MSGWEGAGVRVVVSRPAPAGDGQLGRRWMLSVREGLPQPHRDQLFHQCRRKRLIDAKPQSA
jgi:hypothetical protein